jgi:hypothetical protein
MNWQPQIPEIGKTFQSMAQEGERDPSRPSIEFYRSEKEVVLFPHCSGERHPLGRPASRAMRRRA